MAAAAGGGTDLRPQAPVPYLLAAMKRNPLVASGELHPLQEEHDRFTLLLTLWGTRTGITVDHRVRLEGLSTERGCGRR
jgi:hypothetical protein